MYVNVRAVLDINLEKNSEMLKKNDMEKILECVRKFIQLFFLMNFSF